MTPLVQRAPRFSCEDAARIASRIYGLSAHAHPLPSERDQNFRVGEFVLKIANAEKS